AAAGKGAEKSAAPSSSGQRFDRMAVRARLAVSEPGDAVEREADAVADKVMRMTDDPKKQPGATTPKPGAKDGVARAVDPNARDTNAPSGGAPQQPGKSDSGAAAKVPPVQAGATKPETTGGTKGGAATEQRRDQGPEVRRKEAGKDNAGGLTVPTDFAAKLGAGEALDAQTRAFFESRLGQD